MKSAVLTRESLREVDLSLALPGPVAAPHCGAVPAGISPRLDAPAITGSTRGAILRHRRAATVVRAVDRCRWRRGGRRRVRRSRVGGRRIRPSGCGRCCGRWARRGIRGRATGHDEQAEANGDPSRRAHPCKVPAPEVAVKLSSCPAVRSRRLRRRSRSTPTATARGSSALQASPEQVARSLGDAEPPFATRGGKPILVEGGRVRSSHRLASVDVNCLGERFRHLRCTEAFVDEKHEWLRRPASPHAAPPRSELR